MEYLDIYNAQRERTGRTRLRGSPLGKGEYMLIAHLCIFNSRGELLLQQRAENKSGWPGRWDMSAGGMVRAGEDSLAGIRRETAEELGLDISPDWSDRFYTFCFDRGFDDYFMIRRDVDLTALTLQESEVQRVRWADRETVHALLREGTMVPFFAGFVDLIFECELRRGALLR